MTKDEFFNLLDNSAKWDVAVSINRTNPLPLDRYSVFSTTDEAYDYAHNNPVAYPGQVIAVIGDSASQLYVTKYNASGILDLELLATGGSTEEIKERVTALETWKGTAQSAINQLQTDVEELKETVYPIDGGTDFSESVSGKGGIKS